MSRNGYDPCDACNMGCITCEFSRVKDLLYNLERKLVAEWQPIETAPKDGTAVLIYPPTWDGQSASVARWNADRCAKRPRPYWRRSDGMGKVYLSRDNPPTHWMPLPDPPTMRHED